MTLILLFTAVSAEGHAQSGAPWRNTFTENILVCYLKYLPTIVGCVCMYVETWG